MSSISGGPWAIGPRKDSRFSNALAMPGLAAIYLGGSLRNDKKDSLMSSPPYVICQGGGLTLQFVCGAGGARRLPAFFTNVRFLSSRLCAAHLMTHLKCRSLTAGVDGPAPSAALAAALI
jgi:hypothetical protein